MKKISLVFLLFLVFNSGRTMAQTNCFQEQPSNNEVALNIEAGGQKIANDFLVPSGSQSFLVDKITAPLWVNGGVASVDILFFNNTSADLPGTQIGQTIQNLVPTSQTIIGNAAGYDVHDVVLNLPAPVVFSGGGSSPPTYWVQLIATPNTTGELVLWEGTTASVIGNPIAFDNGTGSWAQAFNPQGMPYDGVFKIEGTCTSCIAPQNLMLNALTSSTATISWTASPDETNGYAWLLMADGDDPVAGTPLQSGTTPVGAISVSLSGLVAKTQYDFYVSTDCGTTGTSLLAPLEFETLFQCNISGGVTSYPFNAGFETASGNLGCWTQIKEVGDGDWIYGNGSSSGSVTSAYAGMQNARFVSTVGNDDPITKLVSPVFDLTGLSNPELSFYHAQENYLGDQNELKVYYRISNSDAWVELAHYTADVPSWTEQRISLPNPTATYQIAFEGINNFGHANVLDEITVGEGLSISVPVFEGFSFYPNPVQDEVLLSSNLPIEKVVVYDLVGKKVLTEKSGRMNLKLEMSNLPAGIYLMKISIGGNSKVFKLLKT